MNVSHKNNYFKVETKFNSIAFYTKPLESLSSDFLTQLQNTGTGVSHKFLCSLITGTCPSIPLFDKNKLKKYALMPPLVFFIRPGQDEISNMSPTSTGIIKKVSDIMGLYHIKMEKSNLTDCKIIEATLVCNYEWMLRNAFNNHQTYSKLFNYVYKYCVSKNIDPGTCMCGFYSCQNSAQLYERDYNRTNIRNLVPTMVNTELPPAPILNSIDRSILGNIHPAMFPNVRTSVLDDNWTALASIWYQGCGLNVLSYYGIIKQEDAREQTVCLPLQGTSIFRILDILVDFFKNRPRSRSRSRSRSLSISSLMDYPPETQGPFFIMRYALDVGITQIFRFILTCLLQGDQALHHNSFIVFKIYKDHNQTGTTKLSQMGHIVSLAISQGQIIFIDPQGKHFKNIPNIETLFFLLRSLYGEMFNYIDIIYTWYLTFPQITYDGGGQINVRLPEITYGGSRKYKHTRKNKKKN